MKTKLLKKVRRKFKLYYYPIDKTYVLKLPFYFVDRKEELENYTKEEALERRRSLISSYLSSVYSKYKKKKRIR